MASLLSCMFLSPSRYQHLSCYADSGPTPSRRTPEYQSSASREARCKKSAVSSLREEKTPTPAAAALPCGLPVPAPPWRQPEDPRCALQLWNWGLTRHAVSVEHF